MAGSEIATAYLAIVPSMKGMKKAIEAELGNVDAKGAGRRMGGNASSGFSSAFGPAIATAAKAATAAMAAAGAAAGAVGAQALASYATYEQLVGGVDKLFGEASGQLQQYAADAYKTAGMSANQYMEQATSFSAALVTSLGGDTAQAAELANVAMVAMSDNVNVFGSNMEDVQNAYQGFAKQNYTMLDNLKLGYGGTQEEMKRLISDAAALTGVQEHLGLTVDENSMSFDNIVKAIQVMQTEMGIAGTTTDEAAKTIEGSVNMAKAAWSNWVTELGKDNADMAKLTDELVESVATAAGNIVPRIVEIAGNAASALTESLPSAIGQLSESVAGYAPQLGESVVSLLNTVVSMAMESLPGALTSLVGFVSATLLEYGPTLLADAVNLFMSLVQGLAEVAPLSISTITELITSLAQTLVDNIPAMLDSAIDLVATILTAIVENAPAILAALVSVLVALVAAIGGKVGDFLSGGIELILGLLDGIKEKFEDLKEWVAGIPGRILDAIGDLGSLLWNAGSDIIGGLRDGLESAWEGAKAWFGDITSSIPSLKGPAERDARLLVENGRLIIGGLSDGLADAWGDVERQMAGYTSEFGAMRFQPLAAVEVPGAFSADGIAASGTSGATVYNITLNADIRDFEGLRTLDDLYEMLARAKAMNPTRAA